MVQVTDGTGGTGHGWYRLRKVHVTEDTGYRRQITGKVIKSTKYKRHTRHKLEKVHIYGYNIQVTEVTGYRRNTLQKIHIIQKKNRLQTSHRRYRLQRVQGYTTEGKWL